MEDEYIYERQKFDTKKLNSLDELCSKLEEIDKSKKVWIHISLMDSEDQMKESTLKILKKYGR